MKATGEILVERPIEVVWRWAADPRNWENWLEGVHDVEVEGRLLEGSRIESSYEYGGEIHDFVYEVVERSAPRRQVVRSVSGPFPFEGTLELAGEAGGTRVRQTFDAGADSLFSRIMFTVAAPLLRRGMRRRLDEQLRRLKVAIELTAT